MPVLETLSRLVAFVPRPSGGPLRPGISDRGIYWGLRLLLARNRALRLVSLAPRGGSGWRGGITCDQPSNGVLSVRGWAIQSNRLPDRVLVYAGDRLIGPARLGIPRPDRALATAEPEMPRCGFELLTDAPRGTGGEAAVIRVVAQISGSDDFGLSTSLALRATDARDRPAAVRPAAGGHGKAQAPSCPRVLVVAHSLSPGGAQVYLVELLLAWRGLGHQIRVVAPRRGALMGRLESAGITVSIAGEFPVGAIDAFEEAASRIISLLDGFAPDLVFINSLGGFIGAEVARRLGRPAVWAIHEGLPVPVFLRAAFGAGLREDVGSRFRELLAHADLAVFESEFSRRLYAPALEEASRGVCVPYGVDVAAIDRFLGARSKAQAREALGLLPDSTVVLCAGTVEPRKAQANLATAFARVKARHKDAHLVLVGDQENLYSLTLHDLVGREALRGCVRLVAVCEDPSLWYRAADIVATVGDVESLPRCLLESMAFGLPVVATDVAGVSELVENEVNGLLCRPNDLADLTRVLDQALRMGEETRQDMGRRGAGLVRDRHDAACYAPQLMEMMRRVLPEEEQR